MVTNLIMMDMPNFDVILDIEFLSRYWIEIDYRMKKVKFNLDSGE